jgi:hypothetical protein
MEVTWGQAIGIARVQSGNSWYWTADFGPTLDAEITPTATPIQPQDCGTEIYPNTTNNFSNLQCMIETSNSCKESKLDHDLTLDFQGYKVKVIYSYNIKINNVNKCNLHAKSGQYSLFESPVGKSEDEKDFIRGVLSVLGNKEGDCVFNYNADLSQVFTKFKNANWIDDVTLFDKGQCSGAFFGQDSNPIPTINLTISPTQNQSTVTSTPTPTATKTPTPTVTKTPTPSPTATKTPTPSPTNTPIPTVTATPTSTPTQPPTPTPTLAVSQTPTATPSATLTVTIAPTETSVPSATNTPSPTIASPGGFLQTIGILGGVLIIIIVGIFLLVL